MKRDTVKARPNKPVSLTVPGGARHQWSGQVRAPLDGVTVTVHGVDAVGGTAPIGSKAVPAGANRIDDILPARSAGAEKLRVSVESAKAQDVGIALSWVEP